jgi:hypothetical protein
MGEVEVRRRLVEQQHPGVLREHHRDPARWRWPPDSWSSGRSRSAVVSVDASAHAMRSRSCADWGRPRRWCG